MAVSPTLRFQILRRDNHTCQSCGRSAPEVKLQVDHVIPEALGGPTEATNLRALCEDCNRGKSATPPDAAQVEQVSRDALRWTQAQQVAAQQMLADYVVVASRRAEFDAAWSQWTCGRDKQPVPRDSDWPDSVDRLLAAGLPMPVLIECIGQAMRNKTVPADRAFRYMCGIAWKRVKDLQKAAAMVAAASISDETPLSYEDGRQEVAREVLEWVTEDRQEIFDEALTELAEEGIDTPDQAELTARAAAISSRHAWCEIYSWRSSAEILLKALPDGIRTDLLERAALDVWKASDGGEYTDEQVRHWAVVKLGHEIKRRFPEGRWPDGSDSESPL